MNYICICIHTHTYACIHTRIHTIRYRTGIFLHMYAYIHTQQVYIHVCMKHTCTYTVRVYIHMHTKTNTHPGFFFATSAASMAWFNTYIHTCMYVCYIRMYMCVFALTWDLSLPPQQQVWPDLTQTQNFPEESKIKYMYVCQSLCVCVCVMCVHTQTFFPTYTHMYCT